MPALVTLAEMQTIEAAADRAGVSYAALMENAGQAVAQAVLRRIEAPARHKILVLCGKGNNGGDGLVAAYHLAEAGATVSIYTPQPLAEADPNLQRVRHKGLLVVDAETDQRWRVLKNLLGGVTVLIDAVFGTGVRLPLHGQPAQLLNQVRNDLAKRAQPPLRVAIDCPSGLNCDTGELDPVALAADLTVTMIAAKRGHFTFPAADFIGELQIADCGVPADLPELARVPLTLGDSATARALLPARPRHAHKYTFGRALVCAGSVNYTGAAYLAGEAAYRVGAGLVTLAVPAPLHPLLAPQLPEATWLPLAHLNGALARDAVEALTNALGKYQAVLLGPGWGTAPATATFARHLFAAHAETWPPTVVDADGLRLLAPIDNWPRLLPPHTVLTPHLGELTALTGLDQATLQTNRFDLAPKLAADWGHVLVLKGAFTLVAAPDGRVTVQPFATAALARAGTGDVLAGMITGLLAQGVPPYEAAVAATYLHGLAGELAAQAAGNTASLLARDVLAMVGQAITNTRPSALSGKT